MRPEPTPAAKRALPFTLPQYPLPTAFSDPYNDWMYDPTPEEVLRRDPGELDAGTLCYIFNSFLPVGSFEEMAPYVPRMLELLLQEPQDKYHDDLLDNLIIWCHLEQEAMAREENKAFLSGMQEAFLYMFRRWTAELNPLYAPHIELLLKRGDYISCWDWPPRVPWLCSEQFLPQLLEQAEESLPHAAWCLYAGDEGKPVYEYPPLPLPPAAHLAALNKVEDWLLGSATPEDIAYWDPIVCRAYKKLHG